MNHGLVGPADELMLGALVAPGQGQYLFMPVVGGDASFDSWQVTIPPVLSDAVRYQPLDSFTVDWVQLNHLVKLALDSLGFLAAQVAFRPPGPHYLTGAGDMKTALGPLMRFEFWHSELPSFLL
jgi:hypothetical protein